MEGLKTESKIEPENLELKKLIDKASARIKLAFKILLIGGVSLLTPDKTFSQSTENPEFKIQEKYQPEIEWLADVSENEKKNLEQEITFQHDWLVDYMNSPKFTERLTKEQMRMEEIGVYGKSEADYQSFLNSPAFSVSKIDKKGDTVIVVNHILKNIEYKTGGKNKISNEEFKKIIDEGEFLETFMPNPAVSKASPTTKIKVKWLKESRLERLREGKIIVVDEIPDEYGGAAGFFNGDDMSIKITKDLKNEWNAGTLVHESTHKSMLMNVGINSATFLLLVNRAEVSNKNVNPAFHDELKNPAEIIAKINQLRFLLEQEGIYNASEQDFNEGHFIKTLKNQKIMGNFAIRQLIDTLKKNDLIWFMNNIAGTSISSVDVATTV